MSLYGSLLHCVTLNDCIVYNPSLKGMTIYDYVWLCVRGREKEKERDRAILKTFSSFCKLFQTIMIFQKFKLFYMIQMFLNFSYFSTNLGFVYLCLPLLTFLYLSLPLFDWRIYAQISCLFTICQPFQVRFWWHGKQSLTLVYSIDKI